MRYLPMKLTAVLLVTLAGVRAGAESQPPGKYGALGRVAAVAADELILANGRLSQRFQVNKPAEAAQLKRHVGSWVKLSYTQTNTTGWWRAPQIQEIKITVLYDADNPFPLAIQSAVPQNKMKFAEDALRVRLSNPAKEAVGIGDERVFAYLTTREKPSYEFTLPAKLSLPQRVLKPRESSEAAFADTSLILPGKYELRVESPSLDGLRILSEPIELEVVSPDRKFTEKTLLARFERGSFAEQLGIAWVLWRDFDSHAGMTKLTAVMDRQERPWYFTAGVILAASGEKGLPAFLRAIRKVGSGAEIHYWAEQACQSPERVKVFQALLLEDKKIPYHRLDNEQVPISHLVAHFLLYYHDDQNLREFPWKESLAVRDKVAQRVRTTLQENPKTFRLFRQEPFHPESIDGLIRRGYYWGSF